MNAIPYGARKIDKHVTPLSGVRVAICSTSGLLEKEMEYGRG